MPTQRELRERGLRHLIDPIKFFRGSRAVALALKFSYNERTARRPRWPSPEALRPELDPIVAELGGRMPTQPELRERGRHDLINAIAKFDGFSSVAAALSYRYEGPIFRDRVEDLRPHLDPIVRELGGRMPTERELKIRGREDLNGAIRKFGGRAEVARALGYQHKRPIPRNSAEDLRPELDPIVAELGGRMPTARELLARQRSDLVHAIQRLDGQAAVAAALGYRYEERQSWESLEDLRRELDPIVAELGGRMPGQIELGDRGRHDLNHAIQNFGGFVKVAEKLGYHYAFASAIERKERLQQLESSLVELHRSQQLSAGQVMLILRHAGLLSVNRLVDTVRRLQVVSTSAESPSDLGFAIGAIVERDATEPALGSNGFEEPAIGEALNQLQETDLQELDTARVVGGDGEPIRVSHTLRQERDRADEVKELRGWSHLGNLLDPAPALIQLSVTRLKIAFYRFANELRGTLAAPVTPPTPEQVEQLRSELWTAAFGKYGELIDNDLVRAACDAYVADLADALLLPRHETAFIPRLYQLDGARFVADRVQSDARPFGLLFDQPGMGKTLTTLWGLAAGGARRIAIVAPLTVKRQVWTAATIRQAFPNFADDHIVADLDAALALPPDEPAVVLLHYEELRNHDNIRQLAAPLADGSLPFDALVFDEAHEVKE